MKSLCLSVTFCFHTFFEILQSLCHLLLFSTAIMFREHAERMNSHLLLNRSIMYLVIGVSLLMLLLLKLFVWVSSIWTFRKLSLRVETDYHPLSTDDCSSVKLVERVNSRSWLQSIRLLYYIRKSIHSNIFVFALSTISFASMVSCVTLSILFILYYYNIEYVLITCITSLTVTILSIPLNTFLFLHSFINESLNKLGHTSMIDNSTKQDEESKFSYNTTIQTPHSITSQEDEKGNLTTSFESSILSGGDGYSIITNKNETYSLHHSLGGTTGGAIFERDHNSLEEKDENESRPFFTTSTSSSPMQIKLEHLIQPLDEQTLSNNNLVKQDIPTQQETTKQPIQFKSKNIANNKKQKKKKKQNLAQIETLN